MGTNSVMHGGRTGLSDYIERRVDRAVVGTKPPAPGPESNCNYNQLEAFVLLSSLYVTFMTVADAFRDGFPNYVNEIVVSFGSEKSQALPHLFMPIH